MTHEKAARIAGAIVKQRVERHELELAETRLSGAVETFSARIDALSSSLRADVAKVETALRADMNVGLNRVETVLKADVARLEQGQDKLRTELKGDVALLRAEAKGRLLQQALIVAAFLAAIIGISGGVIQNLFFS